MGILTFILCDEYACPDPKAIISMKKLSVVTEMMTNEMLVFLLLCGEDCLLVRNDPIKW